MCVYTRVGCWKILIQIKKPFHPHENLMSVFQCDNMFYRSTWNHELMTFLVEEKSKCPSCAMWQVVGYVTSTWSIVGIGGFMPFQIQIWCNVKKLNFVALSLSLNTWLRQSSERPNRLRFFFLMAFSVGFHIAWQRPSPLQALDRQSKTMVWVALGPCTRPSGFEFRTVAPPKAIGSIFIYP